MQLGHRAGLPALRRHRRLRVADRAVVVGQGAADVRVAVPDMVRPEREVRQHRAARTGHRRIILRSGMAADAATPAVQAAVDVRRRRGRTRACEHDVPGRVDGLRMAFVACRRGRSDPGVRARRIRGQPVAASAGCDRRRVPRPGADRSAERRREPVAVAVRRAAPRVARRRRRDERSRIRVLRIRERHVRRAVLVHRRVRVHRVRVALRAQDRPVHDLRRRRRVHVRLVRAHLVRARQPRRVQRRRRVLVRVQRPERRVRRTRIRPVARRAAQVRPEVHHAVDVQRQRRDRPGAVARRRPRAVAVSTGRSEVARPIRVAGRAGRERPGALVLGRLANGLRYVLLANKEPKNRWRSISISRRARWTKPTNSAASLIFLSICCSTAPPTILREPWSNIFNRWVWDLAVTRMPTPDLTKRSITSYCHREM